MWSRRSRTSSSPSATRRSKVPVRTNLLAVTGQFAVGTRGAHDLPARGAGAVGLVPERGLIVYDANKGSDLGSLTFVDSRPTLQVEVRASTQSSGGPFLLGQLNERSKRWCSSPRMADGAVHGPPPPCSTWVPMGFRLRCGPAQRLVLPRNARLIVDYASWGPKDQLRCRGPP